jgi:hypothetical protein
LINIIKLDLHKTNSLPKIFLSSDKMSLRFTLPDSIKNTDKPVGYTSPFSATPADNAAQGKLTHGALLHQFDPPKFDEDDNEPMPPYVYRSRMQPDSSHMNEMLANKENYDGMPGFVDSQLVSESFTQEQSLNLLVILVTIIAIVAVGYAVGWFTCKICSVNCNQQRNDAIY